jgi:hypothetical protein
MNLESQVDSEKFTILQTQGGGHGKMLRGNSSVPFIAKPLIEREHSFYVSVAASPFSKLTPGFLGRISLNSRDWLCLQDLTVGMTSPCIADLKLGTRSFEVTAPPEKVKRQLAHMANTTTVSHAIRCIDICIRRSGKVVARWDRRQGRSMSGAQFRKVLRAFLPGRRRSEFAAKIAEIREGLVLTHERYPNMRLYSASVLAVYDGDKPDLPMQVCIIDFAHAYVDVEREGGDPNDTSFDDNAVRGLDNLLAFAIPKRH